MPDIVRELQHQQLVERGLYIFGPDSIPPGESVEGRKVIQMPIISQSFREQPEQGNVGIFTATEDIVEELPDGRLIMLLRKGSSVPMPEALRRGFVKIEEEEKKPKAPQQPKQKKPRPGPSETK